MKKGQREQLGSSPISHPGNLPDLRSTKPKWTLNINKKYSTLKDILWYITFRDGLPVMSDRCLLIAHLLCEYLIVAKLGVGNLYLKLIKLCLTCTCSCIYLITHYKFNWIILDKYKNNYVFFQVFMAMFVKKKMKKIKLVILICFLFTDKKCNSIFINTDKKKILTSIYYLNFFHFYHLKRIISFKLIKLS